MNNKDFLLEISVDKMAVVRREPLKIVAAFKNKSDKNYQVMTGRNLINFEIWKKAEEYDVYENSLSSFWLMDNKFIETRTFEHRFNIKGEYCISATVYFYILSVNSKEKTVYESIKESELKKLRDSGKFIYLKTEEIIVNVV